MITVDHRLLHLQRSFSSVEGANLHGPLSASVKRSRSLGQLDSYPGGTRSPHINSLGRSHREIDDALANKRATISDAYHCGTPGLDVSDTNETVQWERSVGGGHRMHVVKLSIRAATVVIWRTVPTR